MGLLSLAVGGLGCGFGVYGSGFVQGFGLFFVCLGSGFIVWVLVEAANGTHQRSRVTIWSCMGRQGELS